ncbi:hypothetical protein EC396_00865 [Lutibacter sp. HS1-25]|uniref:RelA/SpoT domain-containing protein n=1 Tax=Lutibacter sp. HS1-25 TaxID=2485000 RepID=UPI001012033C|nr:RelA/SpoT domain-containing protein [Lutibacter sp. HS1-25]RXP64558.1 hypothetical protein EC396_00865 [Lutibacter sp. HS1-25]
MKNQNQILSNEAINRIGNEIRIEGKNPSTATLEKLQLFRTSHKDSLAKTFHILLDLRRPPSTQTIVTYRIKRFESIIEKLNRYPKMNLSRMWDIGGCRVIVKNNKEVYRFRNELSKVLNIRKEYDYIKEPQKEGYKSLHLYVDSPDCGRVTEIQIRNQEDHNWATLVEISDLIFESKLKEYSYDKTLLRFHFLLSKKNNLTIYEKSEIARIIYKYNYIDELSKVFSRNYLKVREQWTFIESKPRDKFYLIESWKDKIPKIESFENFNSAEENYFTKFISNKNANVVLTHLPKPNYNQISIAYSNYILTMHSMLGELSQILESLIIDSLENGNYIKFIKSFDLHLNITVNSLGNSIKEANYNEGLTQTIPNGGKNWKNTKKAKEWRKEINKDLNYGVKNLERFQRRFRENIPKNKITRFVIQKGINFITWKYNKKIKKLIHS